MSTARRIRARIASVEHPMTDSRTALIVAILSVACAASASAQQQPTPDPVEGDPVSLFGVAMTQNERFKISGTFIAAWSHDGAQAQLGFEKQGRVAQATVTFSG